MAHFATALRGKETFGKEFTYSVEARKNSDLHNGSVKPGDELGKWLVDSGASNHFSPFKHLFISLIGCIPSVDILTGNGWVTSVLYGFIPLILLVEGRLVYVNLDNVLYVPTLQTKVNLFSVPILPDQGLHCDFRPVDCKFTLDREILAGGTKISNSWWLDADTRSHSICMAMHDNGQGGNPETLQTWHQRLGHLNKRDIERL